MEQDRKVKELKEAAKNLRMCQDELRMARAKFNQIVNELVDNQ
jgi:hypothetical protein